MNIQDFLKIYREALLFVILALLLIFAGVRQVKPKIGEYISTKNDVVQKKAAIAQIDTQLVAAQQQMAKLEKARIANGMIAKTIFQPRTLSLDNESGYSILFNDIFEMAKTNNIKTYSIQYEYNPADDAFVAAQKGYSVCLLKMKIIGSYRDFENFLTDMYKYPYLISISSYDIVPYYKDKNVLLIKLGVKVYMQGDEQSAPAQPTQPEQAVPQAGVPVPPPVPAN